jgi:hypothetical protein
MIQKDRFEEMEPLEQFPSYLQSEVDRYKMGFDQEQFCSDERGILGTRNVPITECVCSDRRLHAGKPGVPVNRRKL